MSDTLFRQIKGQISGSIKLSLLVIGLFVLLSYNKTNIFDEMEKNDHFAFFVVLTFSLVVYVFTNNIPYVITYFIYKDNIQFSLKINEIKRRIIEFIKIHNYEKDKKRMFKWLNEFRVKNKQDLNFLITRYETSGLNQNNSFDWTGFLTIFVSSSAFVLGSEIINLEIRGYLLFLSIFLIIIVKFGYKYFKDILRNFIICSEYDYFLALLMDIYLSWDTTIIKTKKTENRYLVEFKDEHHYHKSIREISETYGIKENKLYSKFVNNIIELIHYDVKYTVTKI